MTRDDIHEAAENDEPKGEKPGSGAERSEGGSGLSGSDAGADAVKFQLRDLSSLYRQGDVSSSAGEDLGPQYTMNLLAKYSFTSEQMVEILHPYHDTARIAQLTDGPTMQLVDLWPYAGEELRTLDALEPVEPGVTPAPVRLASGLTRDARLPRLRLRSKKRSARSARRPGRDGGAARRRLAGRRRPRGTGRRRRVRGAARQPRGRSRVRA